MKKKELFSRSGMVRGSMLSTNKEIYPTAFDGLDRVLPNGGWPRVGLTEILIPTISANVLRLLVPVLSEISKRKWIVMVSPPYAPFPLAWEQEGADISKILVVELPESESSTKQNMLWAYEQALRFDDCGAALFWGNDMSTLELRKLYLAAEAGGTWGIIFRSTSFINHSSPASLRIQLETLLPNECSSTTSNFSSPKFQGTILKGSDHSAGKQFSL